MRNGIKITRTAATTHYAQPFDHSVSNSAHRALLDLGAAALAAGALLPLALDSATAFSLPRHVSKSLHADEPSSVPFFCKVCAWKARLALPVSHPCRLRLKNPEERKIPRSKPS